jgi:hypothetical protein
MSKFKTYLVVSVVTGALYGYRAFWETATNPNTLYEPNPANLAITTGLTVFGLATVFAPIFILDEILITIESLF